MELRQPTNPVQRPVAGTTSLRSDGGRHLSLEATSTFTGTLSAFISLSLQFPDFLFHSRITDSADIYVRVYNTYRHIDRHNRIDFDFIIANGSRPPVQQQKQHFDSRVRLRARPPSSVRSLLTQMLYVMYSM